MYISRVKVVHQGFKGIAVIKALWYDFLGYIYLALA